MNEQDKAEALRLMQIFEPSASELAAFAKLRALIERQPDDTDGEMWRFCGVYGFPYKPAHGQGWELLLDDEFFDGFTPAEAVQAAMAAMKEKNWEGDEMRANDEPAFPFESEQHPGMGLRDYFAAKAPIDFAFVCSVAGSDQMNIGDDKTRATLFAVWTLLRYEWADAMLAERAKP